MSQSAGKSSFNPQPYSAGVVLFPAHQADGWVNVDKQVCESNNPRMIL